MGIECPSIEITKEERKKKLFLVLQDWIYSDDLSELIRLFNGTEVLKQLSGNIKEDITEIYKFASRWDFRKGKERWEIESEKMTKDEELFIKSKMFNLGLMGKNEPAEEPDFLVPLGGARSTNYTRPYKVKSLIDKHSWIGKKVIALSGMRPINEIEIPFISQYAPSASTEFDAMNGGLEKVFGTICESEKRVYDDNVNNCSAIREYSEYSENSITSIAAPSSEPQIRRANSRDTFCYFLDQLCVKEKSKILLVTSSIYVPFQLLKFIDLAIDRNLYVDCVGDINVTLDENASPTVNYLQEVKSTIDAIYDLVWNSSIFEKCDFSQSLA